MAITVGEAWRIIDEELPPRLAEVLTLLADHAGITRPIPPADTTAGIRRCDRDPTKLGPSICACGAPVVTLDGGPSVCGSKFGLDKRDA